MSRGGSKSLRSRRAGFSRAITATESVRLQPLREIKVFDEHGLASPIIDRGHRLNVVKLDSVRGSQLPLLSLSQKLLIVTKRQSKYPSAH